MENNPYGFWDAYCSTREKDIILIEEHGERDPKTYTSMLSWIPVEIATSIMDIMLFDYEPDDKPLTYTAPIDLDYVPETDFDLFLRRALEGNI